jgi:hypothetical protein
METSVRVSVTRFFGGPCWASRGSLARIGVALSKSLPISAFPLSVTNANRDDFHNRLAALVMNDYPSRTYRPAGHQPIGAY